MSFDDEIKDLESKVINAVETKVKAATTVAMVSSLVVDALGFYVFHGAVPDWVTGLVGTAVTGASTFLAGWLARHTPRPADNPPTAPGS